MFLGGLASGYFIGVSTSRASSRLTDLEAPSEAYRLPVRYGQLGPRLLAAGSIDLERMAARFDGLGMSLTRAQRGLLQDGGQDFIEIDQESALFLLDFFWALGLTNESPILSRGPMTRFGTEQLGRFASTGGWMLGARPATELYGSTPLVPLTPEQSARLEQVARSVYRPCCDNATYFPDCNHGMAMLGMLTLLAANGSDEGQMFEAAAAANAAWYPNQYQELAGYFEAVQGIGIPDLEPRRLVDREVASRSGFRKVHEALAEKGFLAPTPSRDTSAC